MYNYEVNGLIEFLMNQELASQRSRMRTKFVKVCAEKQSEIDYDKAELVKEYAQKDENGELIIHTDEESGQTSYKITDIDSFNIEYDILMREEFIIDETPERQLMLEIVRNVVLNCESAYSGKEALQYDRWCEIVESI